MDGGELLLGLAEVTGEGGRGRAGAGQGQTGAADGGAGSAPSSQPSRPASRADAEPAADLGRELGSPAAASDSSPMSS